MMGKAIFNCNSEIKLPQDQYNIEQGKSDEIWAVKKNMRITKKVNFSLIFYT